MLYLKVQFKSLLQMKPHICKCTGEIYAEVAGRIRKKGPSVGAGGGRFEREGIYICIYISLYVCIVMTDSQ